MVPFWLPIIVPHLIFRVPKTDHKFDNHPCAPNHSQNDCRFPSAASRLERTLKDARARGDVLGPDWGLGFRGSGCTMGFKA